MKLGLNDEIEYWLGGQLCNVYTVSEVRLKSATVNGKRFRPMTLNNGTLVAVKPVIGTYKLKR